MRVFGRHFLSSVNQLILPDALGAVLLMNPMQLEIKEVDP
jgi:hypothetical protein